MNLLKGFAIFFLLNVSLFSQGKQWKVTDGKVFFKSETELESIYGEGGTVSGSLDLSTKVVSIEINLFDLKTNNKLQTSHMHDNYLETNLFPVAKFNGIAESIKENGEIKATGTLELHGLKKENLTLTGTIQKMNPQYEQLSYFTIKLSDFGIQVPKLLFLKLNQSIQVKVKLTWTPE